MSQKVVFCGLTATCKIIDKLGNAWIKGVFNDYSYWNSVGAIAMMDLASRRIAH
jgi:hypothetical protein